MIEPSLPPLPQPRQDPPPRAAVPQSQGAPSFLELLRSGAPASQETDARLPDDAQPLSAPPDPSLPPVPASTPPTGSVTVPTQVLPAAIDPASLQTAPVPATDAMTARAPVPPSASSLPPPTDLRLEFHLHGEGGEREVVAMPWRLMASGHLAQRIDGVEMIDTASVVAHAHAAPEWMRAASIDDGAALPTLSAGLMQGAPGGAAYAAATLASERATRGGAIEHARRATSPAASEWLARWMKWFERDGHDRTVWLRDFRLDDAQTGRVVDDLRTAAREQGLSLDRIVVNGRERWRNPQSGQTKE